MSLSVWEPLLAFFPPLWDHLTVPSLILFIHLYRLLNTSPACFGRCFLFLLRSASGLLCH